MGIPGNKSRLKDEAWHRATTPAGPAGLAAAIRAKQRAEALGQELNVGRLKSMDKSGFGGLKKGLNSWLVSTNTSNPEK